MIIDDDTAVCSSIQLLLSRKGMDTMAVNRIADIDSALERFKPDLILLDMNFRINTSGEEGLRLLQQIKAKQQNIDIILITGWATLQLAVEGMKLGASDFLAKPWDNKHLLDSVQTILDLKKDHSEEKSDAWPGIIGQNKELLSLLDQAKRIAKTNANVLISGPSGVGKELVAEALHYHSNRSEKPFVKVNLGGLSGNLFDSELFGHKKGAFTDAYKDRKGRFELAEGGSIFLDEIGELDLSLQVKLLRVLQEKKYEVLGSSRTVDMDVRVITATNRNLAQMVAQGGFREDLFYRINLITLNIPALDERRDDIPLLANSFVDNICSLYEQERMIVEEEALAWLSELNFPGNVRQLKNLVERTVLMNLGTETLAKADFLKCQQELGAAAAGTLPAVGKYTLEEMDRLMVQRALSYFDQNISEAARSLGVTRSALYRRIQKYKL